MSTRVSFTDEEHKQIVIRLAELRVQLKKLSPEMYLGLEEEVDKFNEQFCRFSDWLGEEVLMKYE